MQLRGPSETLVQSISRRRFRRTLLERLGLYGFGILLLVVGAILSQYRVSLPSTGCSDITEWRRNKTDNCTVWLSSVKVPSGIVQPSTSMTTSCTWTTSFRGNISCSSYWTSSTVPSSQQPSPSPVHHHPT